MQRIEWPPWPQYGEAELEAVQRVIRSRQLFADKEVREFEEEFATYVGTDFACGFGNATQGLHLALASVGVGTLDEVIVTPFSWISSVSCVLMQGAIPIFADIDSHTLALDPNQVEEQITPQTKAVVAVHLYGYPSHARALRNLADKHGLWLIEDASHAHGMRIGPDLAGNFGHIAVFSLHQRKTVSVGDGGIATTQDSGIYEKLRTLRSFGNSELSYNYRMTEFAGALGKIQLKRLDSDNEQRRNNAQSLASLLIDSPHFRVRVADDHQGAVYYAVIIEIDHPTLTAEVISEYLAKTGVAVKPGFRPLNKHPHFNSAGRNSKEFPWEHPRYSGDKQRNDYANLNLPICEALEGRLLEVYAHPGTKSHHLRDLVSHLNFLVK